MQKHQLNLWLNAQNKRCSALPRLYVIGCSDISQYLLAVEFKRNLEPIKEGLQPVHFASLELVKQELLRLGVDRAYLRLYNAYEESAYGDACRYCDIELAVTTH